MQSEARANQAQECAAVPRGALAAGGRKMPAGPRFGFVDLLRGFALVVMIETHVVNAYLPAAARNSSFFFWLSFVNGLVAPSFLFASGFSLLLQARRKWEDWLHFGPAFRKQLRRLGFILLAAYYIHLPRFGLSKFLTAQEAAFWKRAFQVDVLQCIVVSLLIINLLILITRKPSVFAWSAAALSVIAALATPWMWAQDFATRMPLALALFLNPQGVSLFPLFPWTCFVLAGALGSNFFLDSIALQVDRRCMRIAFLLGLAAIISALAARSLPLFSAWNVEFYRTSPLFVLIRLGCVLILCAGLYFMEKRWGWMPGPIRLAGQESLLVYILHLLLIFSILRGKFFSAIFGREAGYATCFLMSAAIIVLMLWLARLWQGAKRDRPLFAKRLLAVIVGLNAIAFLLL